MAADVHIQRVARFFLIQLVVSEERIRRRMLSEIEKQLQIFALA